MKKNSCRQIFIILALTAASVIPSCKPIDEDKYLEEGVSKFLATYRHATLDNVSYNLTFSVPESKSDPVTATEVIEFTLKSKRESLVVDFRTDEKNLLSAKINGKSIDPEIDRGHIVIPENFLKRSYNRLEISFIAGDMSLNRNNEYLYTLLVPDRASTVFPCFDQPDIKAGYSLKLDIPSEWEAISNGQSVRTDSLNQRKTIQFATTKPISTYLFAFAAGRFQRIEKEINGVKMEMLHRETRPEYLANNADDIFLSHYNSLKWLEEYTAIPYPFDKFGFVLIPSFQYSGMEHPGAIYYRASSLLLEATPTLNERLARASLIAHETSHIWFGDLVTMKWFDDVWLKEVFAGYMSDKIVNPDFPDVNHDLRFLLSRYPAAYAVDRTSGTNPVIQDLKNLKDAGSLYGGIIYNKAPVVMRLLEQITGEEGLMMGLRRYLSDYSFGNARWDDLVSILEKETGKPLENWSTMWVKEAGMPTIEPAVTKNTRGYKVCFAESDPTGRGRHWPQQLFSQVITEDITANSSATPGDTASYIFTSKKPVCILPDVSGKAYGSFLTDSITLSYLKTHADEFTDPLIRGIIWINLNETHINGRVNSPEFLEMIINALDSESETQTRDYLISLCTGTFWNYCKPEEQTLYGDALEKLAWQRLVSADDPSQKRTWFNMFRNITLSENGLDKLEKIWADGALPGGQKLSVDETNALAFNLLLKRHGDSGRIISTQRERITDPDRLQRFDFVLPALSEDQAVRDAFFDSLQNPVNREHEPWVIEALGYLHHPLIAETSEKYILPSLEMLEEIKATGDIFFPGNWISATLAGHHTSSARDIVKKFLDDNPDYPADLRLKILQASDHLFRKK